MKTRTKYKGLLLARYWKVAQTMGQFVIVWGCAIHCTTSSPLPSSPLKASWTPNHCNQWRPKNTLWNISWGSVSYPLCFKLLIYCLMLSRTKWNITSVTSWWEKKEACTLLRKLKGKGKVLTQNTLCNSLWLNTTIRSLRLNQDTYYFL